MARISFFKSSILYFLWIWILSLNSNEAKPIDLERRYTTTFTAPTGYRFSWGIDTKRLSYGESTGFYLTRTSLKGSKVEQPQINACGSLCEKTNKCGFFHTVEMKGSSDGNVMCSLYMEKVGKGNATFSTGSGSTPGKVTFSYGFTRDSGSVSLSSKPASSSVKTSSTTSSKSSTTTSSSKQSTMTTSVQTSSTTSKFTTLTTTSKSTISTSSKTTTSTSSTPTSTFISPPNYKSSWETNSSRLSYGSSTGAYLTRSTLQNSSNLGQNEIYQCSLKCESLKGCGFFHPILLSNSSDGNVICSLYSKEIEVSKATYNVGTGNTPGKVVRSFGFVRKDGPVSSISSSTSSTSSTTTSTTSTSTAITTSSSSIQPSISATATDLGLTASSMTSSSTSTSSVPTTTGPPSYPSSPSGATLVQFQPCDGTKATIPMFVNKAWSNDSISFAKKAFIITHGAGRDFNVAFSDIYSIIGEDQVLVSLAFYLSSDTPTIKNSTNQKSNWFLTNETLSWFSTRDSAGGSDAIYPTSGEFSAIGSSCSSYNVYDSLIGLFGDKSKYPFLEQVNVVGHSNGAGTVVRYSVVAPSAPPGITLRFSLANTPSFPYFTRNRPWVYDSNSTSTISSWMYGFESNLSPYVSSRMTDLTTMFKNWVAKDVRTITGTLDTFSRFNFGDTTLPAQIQGGDRRDRNYANWVYRNLLAGTSNDVSWFYGYGNLTTLNGGVQSLNVGVFNHQNCVVDGVGHVGRSMWQSECGQAALLFDTLPAGSPPLRP